MDMKYLIVGGVAAGMSFACRLRRLDEKAEITIYEKSGYVSYANCGLPYYVSGVIQNKESLSVQTPQSLFARFNLRIKVKSEVISIDKEKKRIEVKDLDSNQTYFDNYDKLILATGAKPIKLIDGKKRIFELKNVEDALKIKASLKSLNAKSAIVIGGGFIGVEIAENLALAGLKTAIVEAKSHLLANLDVESGYLLKEEMELHAVQVLLNSPVKEIVEKEEEVEIKAGEKTLKADLAIQALGVRPENSLAVQAGLKLGFKNTIETNANFETSEKDIFAIGDAIGLHSAIDDSIVHTPLAGLANKEGRALADYLIKNRTPNIKALGTSIVKVFDLAAASTGFSEEALKSKNIGYDKIYLSTNDHAGYYPNAKPLWIKLLFRKDDYQILGAQIVGQNGVDKRIDVIAGAIQNKLPADELSSLQLSYAPPFSSAKDPINMLGYMVENLKDGLVKHFFPEDVQKYQKDPSVCFLDVRTEEEYAYGHIENSLNIPLDSLRNNLDKLDKSKITLINCQGGLRSYVAYRLLVQNGFACKHLEGGYALYKLFMKAVNE